MEEEVKTEETIEAPEEVQETAAEETVGEEKPLDKMTGPELREIAKDIPGVTGASAMKKEELLAVIKKHRGIEDEETVAAPSTETKVFKQKIIQLRQDKVEAIEAKDKKQIDILRRRINRLKKKMRKAAHG